jgi:putative hydroxymethylpyrimidine transport system substrate-binding protein
MKKVVALLAAVTCTAALAACGGGAEPGAPKRATLVLDFQPNAVHAGIYAALHQGYYEEAGVDLDVQQPSSSTDAPKLLEAGTVQFAILDIHDLAIAREHGFNAVGVMPIVQRPLASVIARSSVRRPRDLEGRTVGVTGLPSDDAVLDSVVAPHRGDPAEVHRVTIGFNARAARAPGPGGTRRE